MQSNFPTITDFTQGEEGLYQCIRNDAGNWTLGAVQHGNLVGTMRGISAPTMVRWMGGDPGKVTARVMQGIDVSTFRAIARAFYWRPLNCDLLPAGIDAVVFDFGFNAGIRVAARQLQAAAGLKGGDVDGDIGPRTIAAVLDASADGNVSRLTAPLIDMQAAYYRQCRLFPVYGADWIDRTVRREALALRLAKQAGPAAAA
ncbi:glycosyl hydrolase 108 family protein [Komagataeibacter kakiaceti]|uniref:glycosyl hydrolase 108 family protein n=1 Tax=Komagataeibacter kakiaceti TaxID=943261 RepID=UPI001A7EFD90|nr:glycosyl hydrolase 108 family protein [Komagataeibacter kakiaceti]